MAGRIRLRCFFFYCLVHASHVSLACILLLNGWSPLSVFDRSALSDIVASGQVLRTFKDVRTEHGTFSAEIHFLTVHKGMQYVRQVRQPLDRMVFNISNFGDKAMCYADVTKGEKYLFFLTVYQGRLSAKYDDIFGAAAELTEDNEKQVLDYLGWHPWSAWSACSQSCGDGQQSRRRLCSRDNVTQCEGSQVDSRHCNTFSCSDVIDLLSKFGLSELPFGVTRSHDRPKAYIIDTTAKLFLPVSTVYDVSFPHDFSLIMTSRRKPEQEGYVLVLSDISGRQRLAIYLGQRLRLEYLDSPSRPATVLNFDVNIEKDRWHDIAIRVQGRQAVVYFDCSTVIEKKLKRGENSLGTNLMLSIGPYFANFGTAFEGELEQLLLSEDPGLAERQCYFQSADDIGPVKDDSNSNIQHTTTAAPSKDNVKGTQPAVLVFADWSTWSACSDSCGQGRQSRSLSCSDTKFQSPVSKDATVESNNYPHGNCFPNDTPRVQVRTCWVQACAVPCPEQCQNGATCLHTGHCRCSPGYYGTVCQSALCTPGCQNDGICSSPGHCTCPQNFTGNFCETRSCQPPCLNGGRCTTSNTCVCPHGYTGPNCQPYCRKQCHNGGQCVRHDQCRCTKGYAGRYCERPVCRKGCSNGGKCVSPNRCSCSAGYRGRRCHKPRCRPSCKKGGKCIAPNTCLCPPGLLGPRCQKDMCNNKCRNDGHCTERGKCSCKLGFYGRLCQKEKCNLTCLNGGRCRRHKNRCRCQKGFQGRRCEKRWCVYQKHTVPYQKTYRRTVREEVMSDCGPWNWKSCVRTQVKYITVTKDSVRTVYRCV